MTSKINRLILFSALLFGGFLKPANAWIFQEVPDKTMTVRYQLAVAANISTAAVIIDLSDTTNWPHKETGEINISTLRVQFDKAAASTGTIKIGVANFVNTSTGSVTWFYSNVGVLNVSNTASVENIQYQPNFIRSRAVPASTADTDGSTPYLLSSDVTSGSTIYQTDVALPSPKSAGAGGVQPNRGDIILFVNSGTALLTVNVEIQYHSM